MRGEMRPQRSMRQNPVLRSRTTKAKSLARRSSYRTNDWRCQCRCGRMELVVQVPDIGDDSTCTAAKLDDLVRSHRLPRAPQAVDHERAAATILGRGCESQVEAAAGPNDDETRWCTLIEVGEELVGARHE